jgi:Cu(I)/Ag(I) efflux system membrane protein CusA/SilA
MTAMGSSSQAGGGMQGMGSMQGGRGAPSRGGGGMTMGGGAGSAPPRGMSGGGADPGETFRQAQPTVRLGDLAEVSVTTGPSMIKDEDGVLAGYVFADIDTGTRDLGGWVADAKKRVQAELALPPGYRLEWTGQYEFLAQTQERLTYVIPLTVLIIVLLLYLSLRGWPQTLLVFTTLPFGLAGSIWLLAALGYNFSTAVWVGVIAVGGLAAEIGVVMIIYLDEALRRRRAAGPLSPDDIDAAVIEGASQRVRPVLMTVCVSVLSLLPLLWASGVGADVTARTAAPVVGGLLSATLLTLLVLPAAYTLWRRGQLRRG